MTDTAPDQVEPDVEGADGFAVYIDGVPTLFWNDGPEMDEPMATWLAPLGDRATIAYYCGPYPLREPLLSESLAKADEITHLFPDGARPR
jgi:hypothetical protein